MTHCINHVLNKQLRNAINFDEFCLIDVFLNIALLINNNTYNSNLWRMNERTTNVFALHCIHSEI